MQTLSAHNYVALHADTQVLSDGSTGKTVKTVNSEAQVLEFKARSGWKMDSIIIMYTMCYSMSKTYNYYYAQTIATLHALRLY